MTGSRRATRACVLVLVCLATAAGLAVAACDDAILGERLLGCDGGSCVESSTTDGPTPSKDDGCPPAPSTPLCDAGTVAAQRDPAGCVVGWVCEIACATVGGTCSTRAACAGGRWSTTASTDCTDAGGEQGCCRSCPAISAPAPGFCDAGGNAVGIYEGDCLVGFECK